MRKNYWPYISIVMEHAMSHSDSDLSLKHVRAQIRRLRSAFSAPTLARFLGISHAHHCRQPSGRASCRVVPRPVEGKVSARLRISVNPSPVPCGWLPAGRGCRRLEPGVTPRWLGPPSRPRRRVDHSLRSAGFHGDLRATFGSAGTEPGSSVLGAGDGTESREVKAEVAGGGGILGPGLGAAGGRLGSG